MKDWKALAKASGLDLSTAELDRIAQPLAGLEQIFAPMAQNLPPELEPALDFFMDWESE